MVGIHLNLCQLGISPTTWIQLGRIVRQPCLAIRLFTPGHIEIPSMERVFRIDVRHSRQWLPAAVIDEVFARQRSQPLRLQLALPNLVAIRLPAADVSAAAEHNLLARTGRVRDRTCFRARVVGTEDDGLREVISAAPQQDADWFLSLDVRLANGVAGMHKRGKRLLLRAGIRRRRRWERRKTRLHTSVTPRASSAAKPDRWRSSSCALLFH